MIDIPNNTTPTTAARTHKVEINRADVTDYIRGIHWTRIRNILDDHTPPGWWMLPEDQDWRTQNNARICAWLTANGVDPIYVPIDTRMLCINRSVMFQQFSRDHTGETILNQAGEDLVRETTYRRLTYRWGDPLPLPHGIGHTYRARTRNRRKK